jgi:hypothetical protein
MYYSLRKKIKIIMINFSLLFTILQLPAYGSDYFNKICGIGESYIPPKTQHSPHRILFNGMYLVFWESDFKKIEIEPYALVCESLCVEGRLQMNRFSKLPFIVIREHSQIILKETDKKCKDNITNK